MQARDQERWEDFTTASARERQAFWQGVPEAESMRRWEAQITGWLDADTADPSRRGAHMFLQKLLRAREMQPLAEVEVSARAIYATFFDRNGRGEIADFVRRVLTTTTQAEREEHFDIIAGLSMIYGQESGEEALRRIRERHSGVVLGEDVTTDEEVLLSHRKRPHVVMVGNTGSGKSTLLKHLIADAMSRGLGVAVIDPHNGALVNDVLGLVPQRRLQDVYYLSLTDVHAPFPLNVFACENPGDIEQAGQVASFVMHLFETLFFASGGLASAPQFSQVMRAVSRVMIEQSLTMAEIPLLLTDETVRERLTATITNPQVKLFWEEYNRANPHQRREQTASTTNKIDSYLSEPLIRNIVSQQQTIPWRRLMDERRIVLISLAREWEQASQLIGATILGQMLMASFSRMSAPACPEFHVFCDEWQNLVTSDVATWIHEARKGHVVLHLANQSLSQLSEVNRQAALSAGALVVFRVGSPEDAKTLAASFDHTPAPEIRAPITDVLGHLLRRGHSSDVVKQLTRDYLAPLEALHKKLIGQASLFHFGGVELHPAYVIDGQRLLNEALAACQRDGRADVSVHPHALFILGGARDADITQVFTPHLKKSFLEPYVYIGLRDSAFRFGRPGFRTEQALNGFVAAHTRQGLLGRLFGGAPTVPPSVAGFVRMLRLLRQAMEVLPASRSPQRRERARPSSGPAASRTLRTPSPWGLPGWSPTRAV